MNRKSILALMLAAMMILGTFGFSAAASAADAGPATLNFYFWDEVQAPGMEEIIRLFNEQYPDIHVEPTVIPFGQYWTKLQTALPTDSGPDVFWMNDRIPEFISAGLILDLQPYAERDGLDLSPFSTELLKIFAPNGNLYGIPKDYNTIAMYYNKALFDQAGVAYPAAGWNWDDLLAAAQATTVPGQSFGFPATTSGQTCMNNFIFQNGGRLSGDDGEVLVNSPENAETIKFLTDMIYVHKVSPTPVELAETPADTLFLAGKMAMIVGGSWAAPDYYEVLGDNLGVVALPKKKVEASVLAGLSFAGSVNTKYPEAVWQFLSFCATQAAQEATASVVIPAYKGADLKWVETLKDKIDLTVFVDTAKTGMIIPPYKGNNNAIKTLFAEEMVKVWAQEKDIATALSDAEKIMNEEIAKTAN